MIKNKIVIVIFLEFILAYKMYILQWMIIIQTKPV